jgi:hypothetical protein
MLEELKTADFAYASTCWNVFWASTPVKSSMHMSQATITDKFFRLTTFHRSSIKPSKTAQYDMPWAQIPLFNNFANKTRHHSYTVNSP